MIPRYSRPKMTQLWSEEAKYRTWLDVEVLACEAWAKLGKVPATALKEIQQKANFDVKEIEALEEKTRHDVAAFVSNVQTHVGEAGRFIHYGLTSSDILDTALSYRTKKASELLVKELDALLALTREKALRDKDLVMIGRTHGIHAEPITMGMKWLLWHDLLKRSRARLIAATEEIAVGKMSGAVGHYAHTPPEVEKYVCEKLGLKVDSLSTQVIARDRYASYFCALALLGSCIETICVELRHLQRTELSEAREGFGAGQKGSSAMPHKRNPISAENLTGLSRLLRSMVIPALENVALWHERDISHSSVERVQMPDAHILADYMLARLHSLLSGLEVFPERMRENLDSLHGVVYSQRVLLTLIEAGASRDQAYEIVQKNAHAALDQKVPFLQLLKADPRVSKILPADSLDVLFEPRTYFGHIDYLYSKVLKNDA